VSAEAVGAGTVLTGAIALPWATYRLNDGPTRSLHADHLSLGLIAMAVLALAVCVVQIFWRRRSMAWTAVIVGGGATVLAVVEALRRISDANSIALAATGSTTTSYAYGGGLTLLGAVGLVCGGFVGLSRSNDI